MNSTWFLFARVCFAWVFFASVVQAQLQEALADVIADPHFELFSDGFRFSPYLAAALAGNLQDESPEENGALGDLSPPSTSVEYREQFACLNSPVTFEIYATGGQPLFYRWWHNGALLEDQTSNVLTLDSVQSTAGGIYTIVVSNAAGSITNVIRLTVVPDIREEWRIVQGVPTHGESLAKLFFTNDSYSVAFGGELQKFSEEGQTLWHTNKSFKSIVPDGSGGFVVITSDKLERWSPEGQTLWQQPIEARTVFVKSGFIYVPQSYKIRIFDLSGNDAGTLQVNEPGFRVDRIQGVGDDLLCAGVFSNNEMGLARVTLGGETLWTARSGTWSDVFFSTPYDFVGLPDGRVAMTGIRMWNEAHEQVTFVLDHDGTEVWRVMSEVLYAGSQIHMALTPSGSLFTAHGSTVSLFTPEGQRVWSVATGLPHIDPFIITAMAVDAQGALNVVGYDSWGGYLQRFNASGQAIAFFDFQLKGFSTDVSLAISAAGDLYFAAADFGQNVLIKYNATSAPGRPAITTGLNPAFAASRRGEAITFTATLSGAPPLSLRWLKKQELLPAEELVGETNATLTLTDLDSDDAADYYLEVRNSFGVVCSRPATLVVGEIPRFVIAEYQHDWFPDYPERVEVNQGGSLLLNADTLWYTEAEHWQWFLNGVAIPGAIYSHLHLTNVSPSQAGTLMLVGSNIFGASSYSVALVVWTNVTVRFETLFDAGVPFDERSPQVAVNAQDEVFLLGTTQPSKKGFAYPTFFLKKYSAGGELLWSLKDVPCSDSGPVLNLDAAGNVVLAYQDLPVDWESQLIVKKISSGGSILWQTNLSNSPPKNRSFVDCTVNSLGEIFIMGSDYVPGASCSDLFISKLSVDGEILWLTNRSGGYASDITATPDGGVGFVLDGSLSKWAADGSEAWTRGSNFFYCSVDPSGNLYANGSLTMKVTPDGTVQWSYPEFGEHSRANSNAFLLFTYEGLVKYSSAGARLWQNILEFGDLALGPKDEAYVSVGYSGTILTRKIDSSGTELWLAKTSLGTNWVCLGRGIALAPSGDVVTALFLWNETSREGRYVLTRYQEDPNFTPPLVYVTPGNSSIAYGREHCFTGHVATAQSYTLQWFKDNYPEQSYSLEGFRLEGQTNLTLCVPGKPGAEGSYQLVVTTGSSVTRSAHIRLSQAKPFLEPYPVSTPGMFYFFAHLEHYQPTQIQSSTNLLDWQTVTNLPAGSGGVKVPMIPGETRFFRAVQQVP